MANQRSAMEEMVQMQRANLAEQAETKKLIEAQFEQMGEVSKAISSLPQVRMQNELAAQEEQMKEYWSNTEKELLDVTQTDYYIPTSWNEFETYEGGSLPAEMITGKIFQQNLTGFLGDLPGVPETLGFITGYLSPGDELEIEYEEQEEENGTDEDREELIRYMSELDERLEGVEEDVAYNSAVTDYVPGLVDRASEQEPRDNPWAVSAMERQGGPDMANLTEGGETTSTTWRVDMNDTGADATYQTDLGDYRD